jgi:hypothetical protein
MADENTTTTTINVNTNIGTVVSDMTDSIDDGLKEFKKFTKAIVDSGEEAESTFKKTIKQLDRMTKRIKPAVKEFDAFGKVAENVDQAVTEFGKSYKNALHAGNKQAMISSYALKGTALSLASATRQTYLMAQEVNRLSGEFKKATNEAVALEVEIKKGEADQDRLQKSIKNRFVTMRETANAGKKISADEIAALKREKAELAQVTIQLQERKIAFNEVAVAAAAHEFSSKKATIALAESQEEMLRYNKALIDNAATIRQHNRDLRKMEGGWSGVGAAFGDVVDTKFFEYIKQMGSLGLVLSGFALINKALSQTADHAQSVSRIALSLGDTSEVGYGRYAKSAKEASGTVSHLTTLSVELGYSMDELGEAMNKVRSGIRMDKEGRLSEIAIRNLTKEAAQFARVSGMELGASVDMLENRIKRYGMTAAEANASLRDMRITITQMTAGNKNNTIAMGDMVGMIEEASAASQSYIVDTRLMTQAMRGAVNQAEHLGVAQKQAKDVAQGVGKILSGAPDFIKIPAGFSLVDQLLGKDADKVLNRLDAGTRKQVASIQQSLRTGKLDYFVGAKALMDLIGQTDVGIEAQSKQLEETILQGPAAAELIAEQYGIENRATAFMITKMMQDTVEMRKQLGATEVSFATALVKDTAMFNDAIDKTHQADSAQVIKRMRETGETKAQAEKFINDMARKELPKSLELKGLNPEQALKYVAIHEQSEKDKKKIEKEIADLELKGAYANAELIAKKRQELYMKTVKTETDALQGMLHPLDVMTKKIAGPKGTWDVTAKLNPAALIKAGVTTSRQLAKAMGIEYDKLNEKDKKFLAEAITESGAQTQGELEEWRRQMSEANQKSTTAIDLLANGMQNPVKTAVGWIKVLAAKMDAFGPGGLMITGLAAVAGGIYLLHRGQKNNAQLVANLMEGPIYENVYNALRDSGKGGGGPAGGGGEGDRKRDRKRDRNTKRLPGESDDTRRERREVEREGRQKGEVEKRRQKGAATRKGRMKTGLKVGAAGALIQAIPDIIGLARSAKEGASGTELAKEGVRSTSGLIGSLAGGALGAFGGPLGAVAGSIAGNYIGDMLGDLFADMIPEGGSEPFLTPTPDNRGMPDAVGVTGTPTAIPAVQAAAAAPTPVSRSWGRPTGGSGGLTADVGMQSLDSSGALILKVRGIQDIFSGMGSESRKVFS